MLVRCSSVLYVLPRVPSLRGSGDAPVLKGCGTTVVSPGLSFSTDDPRGDQVRHIAS